MKKKGGKTKKAEATNGTIHRPWQDANYEKVSPKVTPPRRKQRVALPLPDPTTEGQILCFHPGENVWAISKAMPSTRTQCVNNNISKCNHRRLDLGFHHGARGTVLEEHHLTEVTLCCRNHLPKKTVLHEGVRARARARTRTHTHTHPCKHELSDNTESQTLSAASTSRMYMLLW